MALPLNTILQGRYRIVRQLGRGGMACVYESIDERLNSLVAIKESLVEGNEERRAFEREANLLANLRHASLPKVIDHFIEDERQFLVMEFIQGTDLAKLLALRGRAFSSEKVIRWGDIILNVLEHLHKHVPPILHRDIKPANLKLDEDGELFLLDFGLAKGAAGQMPTLVTSRSMRGYTPVYAPIEQIFGKGTDQRSDLYALGATLYHLTTNVTPVDAPTRYIAIEEDQPDPLRSADEMNPEVPPAIAAVLSQAMAINRRHRPSSAAEMRLALHEASLILNPVAKSGPKIEALSPNIPIIPVAVDVSTLKQKKHTDTQRLQLEYWAAFREFLQQSDTFLKPPKPQPQQWMAFAIGRTNFMLAATIQRKGRRIGVNITLSGPQAKPHFHLLHRDKKEIEREVGEPLEWRERASGKESHITLSRHSTDPANSQDWQTQHEWLRGKLETFHRAFAPRIAKIRASDYSPDSESREKRIPDSATDLPAIGSPNDDSSPAAEKQQPATQISINPEKTNSEVERNGTLRPEPKKRRAAALLAIILCIILAAVVYGLLNRTQPPVQSTQQEPAVTTSSNQPSPELSSPPVEQKVESPKAADINSPSNILDNANTTAESNKNNNQRKTLTNKRIARPTKKPSVLTRANAKLKKIFKNSF